jgi:glycosyltransferase involved in cell wall biosynthesis
MRAAASIHRQRADVRFVLVGQGPLEADLKREAWALGLDGTIVFAGRREDVPRLLRAFDLFVLPSIHEGLSIALLEAMAAGKPVVVTRVGGMPEVVEDGVEGLIVPPANPEALSRAILTLLRDADLRAQCGDAARQRSAHFNNATAAERLEQVYGELLGC